MKLKINGKELNYGNPDCPVCGNNPDITALRDEVPVKIGENMP